MQSVNMRVYCTFENREGDSKSAGPIWLVQINSCDLLSAAIHLLSPSLTQSVPIAIKHQIQPHTKP